MRRKKVCEVMPRNKIENLLREKAERKNGPLVQRVTSSISDGELLAKTLNKYVKVLRFDHCFLFFMSFTNHKCDNCLLCLEVLLLLFCMLSPAFISEFLIMYPKFGVSSSRSLNRLDYDKVMNCND